jgi:hypothetical protein
MRSDNGRRKGNEWEKENEGGSTHSGDLTVTMSSITFAARDNHRERRVLANCEK